MQPAGVTTALRTRAPCRSAARFHAVRPLRRMLFHPGHLSLVRGTAGPLDSGASPHLGQAGAAAREPGPSQNTPSSGVASSSPEKAPAAPAAVGASGASPVDTTAAAALSSAAAAAASSSPPQQPAQAAPGAPATVPTALAVAPGAGASGSSGSGNSPLPPVLRQLLAWLASVWSAVQQFPLWVQMQHMRRLREACEEDPKDADKHAAYLVELVRTNPREVVARVESRQFGVNSAVVAEYLRALLATGKVTELVKADGAAAAAAAAPAAAAASEVPPPQTLGELLQDLQEQLASASAGNGSVAGDGASLDLAPGSSVRRPLHVVMVGGLPPQMQPTATSAQAANAAKTPLLLRPLALLWRMSSAAVLLLVLAFAYIAGSQAIRRVQASAGTFVNPSAVSAGPPVTSAGGGGGGSGSGAAASSSSGNTGPSVEPKEYKKDEIPEKSIRSFKDVRGCDEAKEELREVVEFLKNPTKFTRLGAKLPKGVLLSGPPGTGKTLLAKAVAGEAGVPFFYRAGSEFEELYVGVGSRRMRALFAAAKKRSPCIVFIDEIDAIGGNRKAWENHTRKTLNQLLVEMDGFEATDGIIVMAATNLPESLDPALKRPGRFDRQVAVPLPDIKGRRDILDYYLADKPMAADVDRELLARQTQGFSGAELSNLINEGAILAAKEGSETISQRMLDWAYDKILMGVERKSVKRTVEARRRTAFHEAGHALVALTTPGASPIHKATIVPRGHALGMVTQVGREDEFSINRQQMLARIHVCMGGTVAEELVFGSDQVSSGATDDLRQATSMARHMVSECGMSAAIGPVYVAAHDERHGGSGVSEATRQRVDSEVTAMLSEAKDSVRALLTERMQDLRTLAEALLDRETLSREEIDSLLQHGGDQQTPTPPPPGSSNSGGGGGSGGDRERREGDEQLEGEPAPATAQVAPAEAEAAVSTASASAAAAEADAPLRHHQERCAGAPLSGSAASWRQQRHEAEEEAGASSSAADGTAGVATTLAGRGEAGAGVERYGSGAAEASSSIAAEGEEEERAGEVGAARAGSSSSSGRFDGRAPPAAAAAGRQHRQKLMLRVPAAAGAAQGAGGAGGAAGVGGSGQSSS